jgi:hypothetical protein
MHSTMGRKRWVRIALAVITILMVGGAVAYQIAVRILKDKVVEALGPGSEVEDIQVGWSGVVMRGLRIRGPQGWPAPDALRAEQVNVVPSLFDLLGGEVRIRSIALEKPYLSALRAKEGQLRVVPTLRDRPMAEAVGSAPSVTAPPAHIATITLHDGVMELFDATVAQPPLKIRLEQLQGSLRNVIVPALTGRSDFDLTGILKGLRQDGRIKIGGWAEAATKDSTVKTELRGVDLVVLQPYLSKAAEVRVKKGTLDLDIQSDVRKNRLRAPGKMTIAELEFASSQGMADTFMGVPRGAVLAFLKDKGNRITMSFVIEGDIDHPQFSLNEAFARRMAASMAEGLGVSIQGVGTGVGVLGRKGSEAVGGAAKGIGEAIGGLFRGQKR